MTSSLLVVPYEPSTLRRAARRSTTIETRDKLQLCVLHGSDTEKRQRGRAWGGRSEGA